MKVTSTILFAEKRVVPLAWAAHAHNYKYSGLPTRMHHYLSIQLRQHQAINTTGNNKSFDTRPRTMVLQDEPPFTDRSRR